MSDELSSQLAGSVSCHIDSSAALLRMSSQETQDCDWIVVSQDAAAKTNTLLASPQCSDTDQQTRRKRVDSADDDVELFSRPRTAGDTITSMVSGATDKLVSYVGSCSHLLTNSFSAAHTPEQIPLMPMSESGQCGATGETSASAASKYGSSIDDSPCTPSFHTPMTTPSEDSGFGGAGTSGTPPAKVSTGAGKQGEMIEISLEEVVVFNAEEAGAAQKPTESILSSNNVVTSASGMPAQLVPGQETSLDGYSLLQSHLPIDADKNGLDEQLPLCTDHEEFSTDDEKPQEDEQSPEAHMPSLAHDKAELLQFELDSSAASNTPSTTLPSSLLSTPSDDLDSYEILESCQSNANRADASASEKKAECAKLSDSSPSPSYMSPTAEPQSLGEGHPLRGTGDVEMKDNAGLGRTGAGVKEDGELADEDIGLIMDTADNVAATSKQTSETSVDLRNTQCPSPKLSSTVDATCCKPFPDPLLSPDSGCLSDEADKLEPAAVVATSGHADGGASKPSLSRDSLRLNLHRTTSNSSTSTIPRSVSQPVLHDPSVYRAHSMTPSDFKREQHFTPSPLRAIRNVPIAKNPYMSPLLAPDWLLEGLPHVCLVVSFSVWW